MGEDKACSDINPKSERAAGTGYITGDSSNGTLSSCGDELVDLAFWDVTCDRMQLPTTRLQDAITQKIGK
jgi:hypothetical protein